MCRCGSNEAAVFPPPFHPAGREALTNAFRHSGASRISVELSYGKRYFRMVCRRCCVAPMMDWTDDRKSR
jgi:hypothetical protein